MAKTLRLMPASDRGWVTKPPQNVAGNILTPAEVDTNFLTLWNDNAQIGTARLEDAATTVHPDWLVLDGTTFSQTEYPTLYSLLGNSTVLPDLTGTEPVSGLQWRIRAR